MTSHNTSTASHTPTQSNAQENANGHAGSPHTSSTTTHPQKKSHRRGSSLPALRHLEQKNGDFTNGRSDRFSEDDDADDDNDCVDTPHDSSDLDDFVQGFCDMYLPYYPSGPAPRSIGE
ncbi:hypothetical protein BGZ73_007742 [Actinomortierella ambigua]|nr:hypothetical protein BGZ73_007742 [Actinomortierella ambigua]